MAALAAPGARAQSFSEPLESLAPPIPLPAVGAPQEPAAPLALDDAEMWKPLTLSIPLAEAEMFAAPAAVPREKEGEPLSRYGPLPGYTEVRDLLSQEAAPALDRLFDLSAPALEATRDVDGPLLKLSERWRTKRQLERLERSGRREGESFRFVVVGDAEPGRFAVWRRIFNRDGAFERNLKLIKARAADFVMQLGDMVSRGLPQNYERFLKTLEASGLDTPYLTVLGNHDRHFPHGRSNSKVYQLLFGSPNYTFDRGPVRFIVLDTSAEGLTQSQLRWLDRVLDTPKIKIVFTHKPPRQFRDWTAGGLGGFGRGSRAFLQIMSRHRVDRVYMGHIHGFGIKDYRGVRYVLTGGGGSPLFPSGAPRIFHHHLVIEVGPEGARETLVRLDGSEERVPPPPGARSGR